MASSDQDPEYLLGDTGDEVERLRRQYKWIQKCVNGKLVFAPADLKKEGLRVLDVGCADGTFLRDLRSLVPSSAQLYGADVMPSFFPKQHDDNIHFIIQDINKALPSDLKGTFDLTNLRFVLAAAAGQGLENAIQNLVDSLASGGCLQVFEMDTAAKIPGNAQSVNDMMFVLTTMFDKLGLPEGLPYRIEELFRKCGMQDVKAEMIDLPLGAKLQNEEDIANSIAPFEITIPSILMSCEKVGGVLPDAVKDNLQERFKKEAREIGGSFRCVMVTGQKRA